MRNHIWKMFLALAISVSLAPVSAVAKGHDRDDHGKHTDRDRDKDRDRGHDRDDDDDQGGSRHHARHHDRDSDRDGDHDRDDDRGRPPGWSKGRKTGWGDCDMPPGLAKKNGCHSTRRRNDHDADDSGRIKPRYIGPAVKKPTATASGTHHTPTASGKTATRKSSSGATTAKNSVERDPRWLFLRKKASTTDNLKMEQQQK